MRFTDTRSWKFLEILLIPAVTAALTGAIIWGHVTQKVDDLTSIKAEPRITTLEANYVMIQKRLDRIEDKLDRVLKR